MSHPIRRRAVAPAWPAEPVGVAQPRPRVPSLFVHAADEQMDTIECESAEAALAVMLIGGREVAMILADVRLPGAMDGIDLGLEVKLRWPPLL